MLELKNGMWEESHGLLYMRSQRLNQARKWLLIMDEISSFRCAIARKAWQNRTAFIQTFSNTWRPSVPLRRWRQRPWIWLRQHIHWPRDTQIWYSRKIKVFSRSEVANDNEISSNQARVKVDDGLLIVVISLEGFCAEVASRMRLIFPTPSF